MHSAISQTNSNISILAYTKGFIRNQYSDWFSNEVLIDSADIRITSKFSNLKHLPATWIVDLYKHLPDNQEIIVHDFDSAGMSEAVTKGSTILDKVKNPFREV